MLRQREFLIGGIIILLATGYLVYSVFFGMASNYYKVDEAIEQGSSIYGENVRVNGKVVSGSVEQETMGHVLKFTIVDNDGEESLPVVYKGIVTCTFKADYEVVVEGYLGSDGIFQAHTLMPKCPYKYLPES